MSVTLVKLLLAASHVGNTRAIASLFQSKVTYETDAIALTEDMKASMAEVFNSTEVRDILKKTEKSRKTVDFVADSVYIGTEVRGEMGKHWLNPIGSPGVEVSLFWAKCTNYEKCQDKCKICVGIEGGVEYDLDEPWGQTDQHNVDMSLMVGGAALDELPTDEMVQTLEFGGGTDVPHQPMMADGIVTKNLKTKKYALMGVEIVPTGDFGVFKKVKEWEKKLAPTGIFKTIAEKVIQLEKYVGEHRGPAEVHADAEVHYGGTACWPIQE